MVVLGGLKPLRLPSSGSGEAGAPEENRFIVHAGDSLVATVLAVPWCLLMLLDSTAVQPFDCLT